MNYYEKLERKDMHPLLKKFEKIYDSEKDTNKNLKPYISNLDTDKKYIRLGDKGQTYILIYRHNDIYAAECLDETLYFVTQRLLLDWYKTLF